MQHATGWNICPDHIELQGALLLLLRGRARASPRLMRWLTSGRQGKRKEP
jgi:hypothetical protein